MTDNRWGLNLRSTRTRGTLAAAVLVSTAAVAFLALDSPDAAPTPPASSQSQSTLPASPTPSATTSTDVPVPAAAPVRVEVPSVALDAKILPIVPRGGELDPPTFAEAYWIEPYGRPGVGSDNTTYLAGHSATRGRAVFDPLFDRDSQEATVEAGDEVIVTTEQGRFTYAVTSTERYVKRGLDDAGEVWDKVPDRLVLITCFQRADGRASVDNLVVFADLVRSEPVSA